MSVREWVNKNSGAATGVAIGLFVVAISVLGAYFWWPESREIVDVYYWDLETEQPFPGKNDQWLSVEAPSGGRVGLAGIFTCGECTPDEWFGYIESFSREAVQRLRSGEPVSADFRRLEGGPWLHPLSSEAQAIRREISRRCGPGRAPTRCRPE